MSETLRGQMADVLARHQRVTSKPGGPCWCGEWPRDDVRRDTWMDHVADALLAATAPTPDPTTKESTMLETRPPLASIDLAATERIQWCRHSGMFAIADAQAATCVACGSEEVAWVDRDQLLVTVANHLFVSDDPKQPDLRMTVVGVRPPIEGAGA